MNLGRFPRRKYTAHETPIEAMPNLSRALQPGCDSDDDKEMVHLWIKRDDLLGLAGGGNKTRKLEFVMADALTQQPQAADTIITCGAVQSNHCRLTLAACNKEGLKCILVVEERVPGSYQVDASGNNYLFHLLGAEQIVRVGLGEAQAKVEQMAAELKSQGRRVYCIPGGASNEIGATGYCACAAEIQVRMHVLIESILFLHGIYATGLLDRCNEDTCSLSLKPKLRCLLFAFHSLISFILYDYSTNNLWNNCHSFIPS
jgi:D-cysteine desulfhydrase